MISRYFRRLLLPAFLTQFAVAVQGQSSMQRAVETLGGYFELLVTGNLESAEQMWTQAAIERSRRFGINYEGIPLKVDCVSPVVNRFDVMKHHLQPPAKHVTELAQDFLRLHYSAVVAGGQVEHYYYVQFDGNYFWLTFPQEYYAREWDTVTSRYFRIHAHQAVRPLLGRVVLDEADLFVQRLADSLELTRSDLDMIEQDKIEFFYCDSEETVSKITGVRTKGTLDLASNDIISSFFPHFHEVVHLLVNIKLRNLPLYTHPLLCEGAAVHYGGRWGKAPTALMELGAFLLSEGIVELDSLLTVRGFDSQATSDVAYPVAGLFSTFLLDELKPRKYWELYRTLSGSMDEVRALSDTAVRKELVMAAREYGWEALRRSFDEFVKRQSVRNTVIAPGASGRTRLIVQGDGFVVSDDGDWLVFEFSSSTSSLPAGNLLFGRDSRFDGVTAMFLEQYGAGRQQETFRYGVRFDSVEAGLYDYATNQLVAKYILGITPSEDYYDPDHNKITFRLRKSLMGELLPSDGDCKLIPLR
ncbi:MAG: hypothetical protein AB1744_09310 [Candidatus Zixiibacteriota bacterium]